MPARGSHALALIMACLLAGCQPAAPTPISPRPAAATTQAAPALVGKVKLPATLIGEAGGQIISNNGGTIISDNGGGLITQTRLRLAAVEERELAGARVELLDGDGQPVAGPDGRPLVAVTDARGNYAFAKVPADRGLQLAVALGTGYGTARALVPRGSDAVDVDLASSLTGSFILQAYVRGSASPQATLDKLSAGLERETRERARAALARAPEVLPERLLDERVVASVVTLGRRDAAFAAQLEALRRLFVTAGTIDQGAGRPALELNLDAAQELALAPDGALLFPSDLSNRVWRLGADGRVQTLVGRGTHDAGPLEGQAGPDAGLGELRTFATGPDGRLWLLERDRLSWLDAGGIVHDRWSGFERAAGLAVKPDGSLLVLLAGAAPALWEVPPAGTPRELKRLPAEAADWARATRHLALAADGTPWLAGWNGLPDAFDEFPAEAEAWVGTLDLASGRFQEVAHVEGKLQGLALLADGSVLEVEGAPPQRLVLRHPDGRKELLADRGFPAEFLLDLNGALREPDGSLVLAPGGVEIFRLAGGRFTKLAGLNENVGGASDEIAFSQPLAVAVRPGGEVLYADEGWNTLFHQLPGAAIAVYLPSCFGQELCPPDGASTDTATIGQLLAMAADGTGRLYLLDQNEQQASKPVRLRRVDPNGDVTALPGLPAGVAGETLGVSAAGDLWVVGTNGARRELYHLPAGAKAFAQIAALPASQEAFAVAADAGAWLASPGKLWRCEAGGEPREVLADARLTGRGLALDARGRLFTTTRDGVLRYDPAAGKLVAVAGRGAAVLAGSTIDDSLQRPAGLTFAPDGALHIADAGHNQFKRVPAERLE